MGMCKLARCTGKKQLTPARPRTYHALVSVAPAGCVVRLPAGRFEAGHNATGSGSTGARLVGSPTGPSRLLHVGRSGKGTAGIVSASGPKPPITDGELLQRHLDGDAGAFAALVRRYQRELFNFLVRFTGDASLAEDVFQETFLQLHLSAATFDMSKRLKPWLFTIAANKARDAIRRSSRRQAAPLDATIRPDQNEHTTYADLMPAGIPAPIETLVNLETRQAVLNIVNGMPENLRLVLLLCYFHNLPYKEIAEILHVPLGTVKSRLHAAVKHFARKWQAAASRLGHDRKPT